MLDTNTFGNTPAAMYLACHLNELGDKNVTRAVSKFLTSRTGMLNAIDAAASINLVTIAEYTGIVTRLKNDFEREARETQFYRGYYAQQSLINNLVANILIGRCRTLLRMGADAKYRYREQQRSDAEIGTNLAFLTVPEILQDENEIAERLKEKSRRHLERRGKKNTLY